MKHLASLFLLSFLLCCSCSQQMDDEWKPNEQLPNVSETHPVGVSFSRASLETFAEHGITEVGVYVYLQDSMVYGKNLPLNNGDLKSRPSFRRKSANLHRGKCRSSGGYR